MGILARVLLTAALALGISAHIPRPVPEAKAKESVALLHFAGGGSCSGTFIGPGLLLTASHCFGDGANPLVTINWQPVNVESIRHDGADHALVVVDYANPTWVQTSPNRAEQGQPVFMYGNPAYKTDLFRRGYISGWDGQQIYVDMMIGHGDSGAGVFDDQGRLIGVVTGYGALAAFHIGVMRPIADGFLPQTK